MTANGYVGETEQKRIARALLYWNVMGYGRLDEPQAKGLVVTLAGPEAREFEILRRVLGENATGLAMVDIDEVGVRAARAKGAWAFHGPLHDALAELKRTRQQIGFIHFDFMGHDAEHVVRAMRRSGAMLSDGSIVAWTFLRGREGKHSRRFQAMRQELLRHEIPRQLSEAWQHAYGNDDSTRWMVREEQAREWLTLGVAQRHGSYWLTIARIEYDSGNSPMGILVMKKYPVHRVQDVLLQLRQRAASGMGSHFDVPQEWPSVKDTALRFVTMVGEDDEARKEVREFVEHAMGIDQSQLSAWLAVRTRQAGGAFARLRRMVGLGGSS